MEQISYYDNYDFDGDGIDDSQWALQERLGYTAGTHFNRLKGKKTGTKTKILDDGTWNVTTNWINTVLFFDDKGQMIQTQSENHLGGVDVITSEFNFSGQTERTERFHTIQNGTPHVNSIENDFFYDHAGRLLRTDHTLVDKFGNSETITLSALEYNNVGQVAVKRLHSTNQYNYLQNIDYQYNIRGWLTEINDVDAIYNTSVSSSGTIGNNPIDEVRSAYIEIEMDVSKLNAGNYEKIRITDEAEYKKGTLTEQKTIIDERTLENSSSNTSYINTLSIDYSTKTITEANYEQEFENLRTDLNIQMDNLSITDQRARDLIEDEVLGYYRDNWELTIENDVEGPEGESEDLFHLKLDYTAHDVSLGITNPTYNSSIDRVTWRIKGQNKAVYGMEYDELNRIKSAIFATADGDGYIQTDQYYSVKNITYDLNGNITSLDRMGLTGNGTFGWIDQLSYTYNANQLLGVNDAALDDIGFEEIDQSGTGEYEYDLNGNITRDKNKDIFIIYNASDLPIRITKDVHVMEFLYDAVGNKLAQRNNSSNTSVHFIDGIEYIQDGGGQNTMTTIYHEEGRITIGSENQVSYQYALKDHLGNIRVIFEDYNGNGLVDETEIVSQHHYYPFGMSMDGWWSWEGASSVSASHYRYQYNGIEFFDE